MFVSKISTTGWSLPSNSLKKFPKEGYVWSLQNHNPVLRQNLEREEPSASSGEPRPHLAPRHQSFDITMLLIR